MHDNHGLHGGHHHAGKSSERFLDKEIIIRELDISPGEIILDAGCGNGYMSKEFSRVLKNTGTVYALDPDAELINVLTGETRGTNIVAILGDITRPTGLAESSIDLIYLATVLHGFAKDQIDSFYKEVKRLLKPQGILAIVEIKKEPTPFGPPLDIRFSPQELIEIFPLIPQKTVDLGQYFYMQLFQNTKEAPAQPTA
jgi:ubiquinone/menaquinone biosynthesis C-methylase UbiE